MTTEPTKPTPTPEQVERAHDALSKATVWFAGIHNLDHATTVIAQALANEAERVRAHVVAEVVRISEDKYTRGCDCGNISGAALLEELSAALAARKPT